MKVEDVTKAMWVINGDPFLSQQTIVRIDDGYVSFGNGKTYTIQELVEVYDEEYGC